MVLFRRLLGDVLRRHRQRQSRTLRDVAAAARISLGYLSEIERGRKEASSELLAALCQALGVSLADILREVSADLARLERGGLGVVGFGAPAASAAASPAVARPVATLTRARPATARATGVAAVVPAVAPAVAPPAPVARVGLNPAARRPVAAA